MLILIKHCLEVAGYERVRAFYTPGELLAAIERGYAPDMILSDFRMPGMTGDQLLRAASRLLPRMRGILITGNPDQARACSPETPVVEKGSMQFTQRLLEQIQRFAHRHEQAVAG
jgi:CheY-like chemotaxis protein